MYVRRRTGLPSFLCRDLLKFITDGRVLVRNLLISAEGGLFSILFPCLPVLARTALNGEIAHMTREREGGASFQAERR